MQQKDPPPQGKQDGRQDGKSGEGNGKKQDKKVQIITTYASVNPGASVSRMIKKPEWKAALKHKDLSHIVYRKMRATALGEILLFPIGHFSVSSVLILSLYMSAWVPSLRSIESTLAHLEGRATSGKALFFLFVCMHII